MRKKTTELLLVCLVSLFVLTVSTTCFPSRGLLGCLCDILPVLPPAWNDNKNIAYLVAITSIIPSVIIDNDQ